MKLMNDRVFFDSNILIYSYSNSEMGKQVVARNLIAKNISYISTQTLQELTNVVTRKFKFSYVSAQLAIEESCKNHHLHINTEETILQACRLAERYMFSFYDSLVISAALECDCSILYSEDMHCNINIDDRLTIVNPFV